MDCLILLACASLLAVGAFAQAQEAQSDPVDGLILPVPGSPLSVEAVAVTESIRADGAVTTSTSRGRIYRDEAGRTRIESTLPLGPPGESLLVTRITDPIAGFQFILFVHMKMAYRAPIPKVGSPGRPRFVFVGGSELIRETGEKTHKNEALGKQMIEGIEFEGSRTTTTMVAEPSKVAVDEYWISQDEGLIGLMVRSSPKGRTTVNIRNLARKEPDPTLFVVPPEYTIEDFANLAPPK